MNKFIPKLIGFLLNLLSYISPKLASDKAMTLFATPRKGKLNEQHKKVLKDVQQDILKYDGMDIMTYHWKGKRDTVLLVHGWESNTARWKKLIKSLLKDNYNIVALDGPAHGASGSDTFNAILYAEFINIVVQKFQPTIIVGHSVGGMASVFYQYKYQYTSLEKLVLLGAPSDFKSVFKRYVDMMNYNKRIENGLNQIVYNRFGYQPSYFSTAKFAKEISQKGLLIHDLKDEIIPYEDAKKINKNYSNSELITTEGFGHGLKDSSVILDVMKFINN